MQAVNLLPADARPGHPWAAVGEDLSARRVLNGRRPSSRASRCSGSASYVHERSVVNDRRATLPTSRRSSRSPTQGRAARAAQAAAAARMAAAGTVSSQRIAWEGCSADLSRVLPAKSICRACPCSRRRRSPRAAVRRRRCDRRRAPASRRRVSRPRRCASRTCSTGSRACPWLSNVTLQSSTCGGGERHERTLSSGDTFSVSAGFNPTGGAK